MAGLVIHSLRDKKNWFLLNIVICIVVSVVLPLLFKTAYGVFSVSSLFFASIIILISTFSDLSFLHDDRKIAYYLSKPISLTKKINVALISNIIFCTVTFAITFLIASSSGTVLSGSSYADYIKEFSPFFNVMYAWSLVFIFVIALSSELTGNTTISVLVSAFNFALPLIIYFITTYIFYILDTVIVGIDTEIMATTFINKILPLDKIYFLGYATGKLDSFFHIRTLLICVFVYIVTLFFAKKRRNENTGNFIVHSSFKYFISLFASLIAPMFITMIMSGYNLLTLVATLVVLSTLSYYILISVFNKTFKISASALKIFVPFILVIVISIFTASAILSERAAYIPDESEVTAVYIGTSLSYLSDESPLEMRRNNRDNIIDKKYKNIKDNDSIVLLQEKDSIKKVLELQKQMKKINEKNRYRYDQIYIIYYLNNGKKMTRVYETYYNSNDYSQKYKDLNKSIMDLAKSQEFINDKYRVFIDDNYINNVKLKDVYIYVKNKNVRLDNFDYKLFSKYFMEDYATFINDEKNLAMMNINLFSSERSYEFIIYEDVKEEIEDGEICELNFEYEGNSRILPIYMRIDNKQVKTKKYIESLLKK